MEELKLCDQHSLDLFLPENLIKQICCIFCCYFCSPSICFPRFEYRCCKAFFFFFNSISLFSENWKCFNLLLLCRWYHFIAWRGFFWVGKRNVSWFETFKQRQRVESFNFNKMRQVCSYFVAIFLVLICWVKSLHLSYSLIIQIPLSNN